MPKSMPKILSIARSIVCTPDYFTNPSHGPSIHCGVTPVPCYWNYWAQGATDSERKTLYRFLNGEQILCESNWIEFVVPKPRWNAQKLLDYLIVKNPGFKISQVVMNMPVTIKLVPESIKLLRLSTTKKGSAGETWPKFKFCFSTMVQLNKPIKELTAEELDKHFALPSEVESEFYRGTWRAIKTIAKEPGGVYCSYSGKFFAKPPRTDEEYDRIFIRELGILQCTEFECMVRLAQEMSLLRKYAKFQMNSSHVAILCAYFMESNHTQEDMLLIRLPRTDLLPHLFVENVRKGAARIRERMKVWAKMGCICDVSIKFGDFEMTVAKPSLRDYWDYISVSTTSKFMFESNGDWEQGKRRIMELATSYLDNVLPFLEELADFVESLLTGTQSIEVMSENLSRRILDGVRLSPADYLESEIKIIKDLATRCLLGV